VIVRFLVSIKLSGSIQKICSIISIGDCYRPTPILPPRCPNKLFFSSVDDASFRLAAYLFLATAVVSVTLNILKIYLCLIFLNSRQTVPDAVGSRDIAGPSVHTSRVGASPRA
jgi:hypothetical protein